MPRPKWHPKGAMNLCRQFTGFDKKRIQNNDQFFGCQIKVFVDVFPEIVADFRFDVFVKKG